MAEQKYEYKVITTGPGVTYGEVLERELNKAAAEGWRVVSSSAWYSTSVFSGGGGVLTVLEREKPGKGG